MAQDLYSVIGVNKTADADAIKKAYRKLAKDLHPDKNPGNAKAEARFKSVNHAWEVLSDPKKRALYDEFGEDGLREGFDADRMRQYQSWQSQGGGAGGRVRLEDLFGGGGFSSDGFADLFGGGRGRRPSPGPDMEGEVRVDFVSAVVGKSLDIRPGGKPISLRIPPGTFDGARMRIAGHGGASPNGGPPGDLILTVRVDAHRFFRREGDDLHLDLPITLAEGYFGAKVKVPTLEGAVTLTVPAGTQSGQVMRLRAKGVRRKGQTAGDLYVHFLLKMPAPGTAEVEEAIKTLGKFQTDDVRADIVV